MTSSSTRPISKLLIVSSNVRAGKVIDPVCSIWALTQVVIESSKSVAASLRRASSVSIKMFCVMGSVALEGTARRTTRNPRVRLSCMQVIFIPISLEN